MIVELRPTVDKHHLLIRLTDEKTLKKTLKKKSKVVEEVNVSESDSSSELDDVFYTNYFVPKKRSIRSVKLAQYPCLGNYHSFKCNNGTAEES